MSMCVDNLNCLMNVSHNNLTSAVSELKITELKKKHPADLPGAVFI